jgi:two-component system chemotaxis sensor kinase CheA
MSAELDMTQYLDLFLQEAEEQMEILEQETLKLEQDPSQERLQVIFRAAHTLKGSSRAMGFAGFAQLTHEMENVLDQLRNGLLAVTTEICDALLACIDTLGQMKDGIASGNGDRIDCTALVAQLTGFLDEPETKVGATPADDGDFVSALTPEQAESLRTAMEQAPVFHARLRLASDCAMKFVRAFMAIRAAEEAGEVLLTLPDAQALEDERFERDFELFFQSGEDLASLRARFGAIGELDWFDVAPWSGDHPAQPAEATNSPPAANTTEPHNPAPEAPQKAGAAPRRAGETGQTVRVDIARLDSLMNLVGELVIDRTRIAQIGADLAAGNVEQNVDALLETVGHIARITTDLQDQIMKARMLPIETVFNRFPRVIRDLAHKLEKDVKLELLGGETELDRSVIEAIGDPLLHILRNSVDHGIEKPEVREAAGKPRQGTVVVSARHHENHIVIDIIDDGKGIDHERVRQKAVDKGLITREAAERLSDKEALQFIFASGLSTAVEVSEVSGRGVGMDIVRSNIQKLGGIIDLDTEFGKGSKFSLRLPLTLAIIRGLLIKVSEVVYVLPLGSVIETLLVERGQVQRVNQREVIVIRGVTTPLVRLDDVFGSRRDGERPAEEYVVIVGLAEQRVGLVVDSLVGEQEVVIKSLSRFCGDVNGVSGATILGDGNVALIADVNGLFSA